MEAGGETSPRQLSWGCPQPALLGYGPARLGEESGRCHGSAPIPAPLASLPSSRVTQEQPHWHP